MYNGVSLLFIYSLTGQCGLVGKAIDLYYAFPDGVCIVDMYADKNATGTSVNDILLEKGFVTNITKLTEPRKCWKGFEGWGCW